jgi:signal peptidase I
MEEKVQDRKSKFLDDLVDIFESIIYCMLVIILLNVFVFKRAEVDGASMEPTLINKDRLIYVDLLYKPDNGDVIIIDNEALHEPLVKRVIALSGQQIDIKDGYVYVDGQKLNEQVKGQEEGTENPDYYISDFTKSQTSPFVAPTFTEEEFPVTIPEGYVFVMGDNRPVSNDSRSAEVGLIPKGEILGKVVVVYSPVKRIGIVK